MNIPDPVVEIMLQNFPWQFLGVLVLFIILTTELWRGVKWLLKVVFKRLFNKSQKVSPKQIVDKPYRPRFSPPSEINNPQGKKSATYANLNKVQSTRKVLDASCPSLPVAYTKNGEYLEVKV